MSSSPRRVSAGAGTLKAFRLSDLPAQVLEYGVSEFERIEVALGVGSPLDAVSEMVDIQRAAERPSDRVYYIPVEAWVKVGREFGLVQVAA